MREESGDPPAETGRALGPEVRARAKVRRRERVAAGEAGERSLEVREVDPLNL